MIDFGVVACLPVPRVIFVFLRFPIERTSADAHSMGPTPLDSFRPGRPHIFPQAAGFAQEYQSRSASTE